jgi:hypothetical protein
MHTKDARAAGQTEQRIYSRIPHRGRSLQIGDGEVEDQAGKGVALNGVGYDHGVQLLGAG